MTLRIWLIKNGESIPLSTETKRQRTGMLADTLQSLGHQVEWWTSTHQHLSKQLLFTADQNITTPTGIQMHFLHAGSYRRNISLARIWHHRRFAHKLKESFARSARKPDVIVVCYPIIEAALVCLEYAKANKIPVIVDVRDQWPDSFVNYAPGVLKLPVWVLTRMLYASDQYVLAQADALTSMSTPILEWAIKKAKRSYDAERMKVFYLCSDLDPEALDSTPSDCERLLDALPTKAEGMLRCTYLGTLNNTADLMTVADAIVALNTRAPESYYFTIGGDGDLMSMLKERLSGCKNVMLTGWLNKQQCHQLLRQTDVALLSGKNEAMPNKVFDYIAYGLPMLCSLRGECRSFIGQYGIGEFSTAGDVEELIAALETIRRNGISMYRERLSGIPPQLYQQRYVYAAFSEFIQDVARQARLKS